MDIALDLTQPYHVLPTPQAGATSEPVFDQSQPYRVDPQPVATSGPAQLGPEAPGYGSQPLVNNDPGALRKFYQWAVKPLANIGQALPFATELKALRENEEIKYKASGGTQGSKGGGGLAQAEQVVSGIQEPVGDVMNFFTSPAGLATLGTGALPVALQRAVAAGFALHMASSAPQIVENLSTAIKKGDPHDISKASTEALLTGYFTYKAGQHALTGTPTPQETPNPLAGQEWHTPIDGKAEYVGQEPKATTVTTDKPVIDVNATVPPADKVLQFNPNDPQQQRIVLQSALERALGIPEAPKQLGPPAEPVKPATQDTTGTLSPVTPGAVEPSHPVPQYNPDLPSATLPPPTVDTGNTTVAPGSHPIVSMVEGGTLTPTALSLASSHRIPGIPVTDLAHDAVTHLWTKADQMPPDANPQAWATTVMRNYMADQVRRAQPMESLDAPMAEGDRSPLDTMATEEPSPSENAHASGVMEAYRKAKSSMAPEDQAILDAFEGRGKVTQADIAKVSGVSQQAISQRLPKIREQLAQRLAQAGVDPEDYASVSQGLDRGLARKVRNGNPNAGEAGFMGTHWLDGLARVLQDFWNRGLSYAQAAATSARMFGNRVLRYVRDLWGNTGDPNNPSGLARLGRKYFTSRGLLPPEVDALKSEYHGALAEWNKSIALTARDIERAGAKDNLDLVDDYLRGRVKLDVLPPKLQAPVATARAQIDHLSGEIINSGLLKNADVIDSYLRSLGKYLNRSYQIHTDRNWQKKVPKDRVDDAVNFVQSQAVAAGSPMTRDQAVGAINEILRTPHSDRVFLANGSIEGSKNLGILQKRKAIPDVIRRLYGENKDPITNYVVTAGKQAQLVSSQRYLHGVRASGMGSFLFDRPTGDYATRIAAETTPELAPLNGLYTTEDIYQALQLNPRTNPGAFISGYRKLNSWVNWNVTVGSIKSQIRNAISNPLISLANGNLAVWKVPGTLKDMAADLGWTNSQAARADLLKMYKLDLLGPGSIGENRARLKASGARITDTPSEDFVKGTTRAIVGSPIRLLNEMWRQGDNVFRVYDWKNEVAKLKRAYPGRPADQLEREAAEIVRATRPTYERAPAIVKAAKDVPGMGNFITWSSEMLRTSTNTFLQGVKEISTPATRSIGVARLLGLAAAVGLVSGLASYSAHRLGITGQQEADRKRFGPEWEKNSDLIFFKSKDGKVTTADTSFLDVYKVWKEPAMALATGQGGPDRIAGAVKAFLKPYVSESILTSTIIDLERNRTSEGKPIWIDGDTPAEQWRAGINYAMGKAGLPGTIRDAMRLYYAETGKADFTVSPKGREYDKTAERLSLTGIRSRAQDVEQGLLYHAVSFRDKLNSVENIFENRLMASGKVDPDALDSAFTRMINQRDLVFRAMIEDVHAAQRLGVPDDAVIDKLRGANLKPPEIRFILGGEVPPYRPGAHILRAADEKEPWRADAALRLMSRQ
jgi:RNA polymerase sigma factor (sigma-70 family)